MAKMSSKAPTLVLNTLTATAMSITAMGLAGCGPDPDAIGLKVYDSPEACARDGGQLEKCQKDDASARALHTKLAPKYDDKKDCEEDWGASRCEKTPVLPQPAAPPVTGGSVGHGGGGSFVYVSPYSYSPYYAGYASGHSPSGSYIASPQPVYRAANGSAFTSAGTHVQHGGSYHAGALQTPAAPAKFAPGTSVSKGNSTASFGKSGGSTSSAKAGGFGSAGRAGGMSMGG
jgi:uncharacterized protein YgiB involved in biofilm formation